MTKRELREFPIEASGNVAIIFALTAAILFGLVGGAVDYGRWLSARSKTLHAMDAAVLAAGRVLQLDGSNEAQAVAVARQYYERNKSNLLANDDISFSVKDGEIVLSISRSSVKTPFLGIIGLPSLPVNNVSRAILAAGGNAGSHVEIALMLDITGSMCGSSPWSCSSAAKLDDMKTAAKDLVNIVVWQDQSEFTSRVALVPFSEHVNLGRAYFEAVTNRTPGGTDDERTCVRERSNGNRYSGAVPSDANGYFDAFSQTSGTCQPSAAFMPLTSDKATLKAHIDSFGGRGGTAGHLGTQFAWYALDPNWSDIWGSASSGRPYSAISQLNENGKPSLYKIAVLMTDGEFNKQYSGGDSADQARQFCSAMKNKGIIVYTVGFDIGSSGSAYDTLRQCATSDEHFYNAADGQQLRMAFRDIALKISTLRLAE
jgi:Flp pilus assembly protein TadG